MSISRKDYGGKAAAKLARVENTTGAKDRKAWIRELRAIQRKYTLSQRTSIDAILAEIREDRL